VVPVQPERCDGVGVPFDDLGSLGALVAGAAVGGGAELGDRHRRSLRDEGADAVAESVGDLSRPVEVDRDEVEGCPVDMLEWDGGVGDLATEALADDGHGRGEEVVDARGDLREQFAQALPLSQQLILRALLASASDDPELLAQLRQQATGDASASWLTVLGRAVARGEAAPEALHPRAATVAIVLLRNEYVTRGLTTVPDSVVVEIVDEVYLPLVRGRSPAPS
jgi:Tetracyclin repressor-like, C-terminal domain